ncbi:hypothetical protein JGU71_20760 [Antrihabitans sp. YC3-6]|uniref:Uncharacterized protein n=1 Tax=Antrihabitans stalagmiti TaxID=2799499 RepID=A0A934NU31_9NOCA|nr:hypothetical protein [Antrihabitans stalagmiti]MBJ8341320.1 hypothetical protein [Antrihabitans stalagmiti]
MATLTGTTAILAAAGAIALMTGVATLNDAAVGRIPFHSPVFGGIALALVVAVPMAVTTRLAIVGDPRATVAAIVAGLLLVVWIATEMAVVKELSWLQPSFVVVGVLLEVLGLAAHREWWPSTRSDRQLQSNPDDL